MAMLPRVCVTYVGVCGCVSDTLRWLKCFACWSALLRTDSRRWNCSCGLDVRTWGMRPGSAQDGTCLPSAGGQAARGFMSNVRAAPGCVMLVLHCMPGECWGDKEQACSTSRVDGLGVRTFTHVDYSTPEAAHLTHVVGPSWLRGHRP